MHAGLAARGLACVRVRVQVTCSGGQEITRLWRHDGLLSALAVAERVRWQLAGWRAGPAPDGGAAGQGIEAGGITLLRLIPDQLVRDEGRQFGLWGDAVISDRVARAAVRVQAMLGHGAVTRPLLVGGRSPAEQVTLVPFGDAADPRYPAGRPWPGRLPAPAPAAITSWAGPWPVDERWWRPASACRKARFQLVTGDGSAWLATVQNGRWLIEAGYDLLATSGVARRQITWAVAPRREGLSRPWVGTTCRYRGVSSSGVCPGGGPPGRRRTTGKRTRMQRR